MTHCPSCDRHIDANASFCAGCGTPVEASPSSSPAQQEEHLPFPVGAQIGAGRYRLDALLGQGGMGTVYVAHDSSLDRRCALKVLNAELTSHPTARKRMEREARALARIDHPNVLRINNIFVEEELLVIELEYMAGGDLQGLVGPDGMSPSRAVELMRGLLAGLQALHDAQLLHRDIKPENVLLTKSGIPKISDLGVARDEADTSRTRTRLGAVLGTVEYMSPEQIQGSAVDRRTDIYSCGVLFYHLLTGALPFSASSDLDWQIAHVRLAPDLTPLTEREPGLAEVIAAMLEKDPDARPDSAATVSDLIAAKRGGDNAVEAASDNCTEDSQAEVLAALTRIESELARQAKDIDHILSRLPSHGGNGAPGSAPTAAVQEEVRPTAPPVRSEHTTALSAALSRWFRDCRRNPPKDHIGHFRRVLASMGFIDLAVRYSGAFILVRRAGAKETHVVLHPGVSLGMRTARLGELFDFDHVQARMDMLEPATFEGSWKTRESVVRGRLRASPQ